MTLTLDLPDDIASEAATQGADLPRILVEGFVAEAYRRDLLSMDQARRLLGFGVRYEVNGFLKERAVYDDTIEDFE